MPSFWTCSSRYLIHIPYVRERLHYKAWLYRRTQHSIHLDWRITVAICMAIIRGRSTAEGAPIPATLMNSRPMEANCSTIYIEGWITSFLFHLNPSARWKWGMYWSFHNRNDTVNICVLSVWCCDMVSTVILVWLLIHTLRSLPATEIFIAMISKMDTDHSSRPTLYSVAWLCSASWALSVTFYHIIGIIPYIRYSYHWNSQYIALIWTT